MNNLFVFGCSFTHGLETKMTSSHHLIDGGDNLIWPEILSKELNLNLINKGEGGFSNDKIFDSIIDSFDSIGENDVVIIEKTYYNRFDVPFRKNDNFLSIDKFFTINPNFLKQIDKSNFIFEEKKSLQNLIIMMDNNIVKTRIDNRFNFIEKVLIDYNKVRKCIIWNLDKFDKEFETIKESTNNLIDDQHWSFKGHHDFAKNLLKEL